MRQNMKTQTSAKRATRRLAASLAIITALATTGAWAHTSVGNTAGQVEVRNETERSEGGYYIMGYVNGATGIVNNVSGTLSVGSWMAVGWKAGSYGELNMKSGAVTVNGQNGGAGIFVGYDSGAEGHLVVDGGSLNVKNDLIVGRNGTGTLTINGGTVEVGSSTTEKWTKLGDGAGSTGTINLNGGKLKLSHVRKGNGTASLVFNGGTLVANGASTQGLIRNDLPVTVNAGGGTIDNDGLNVTVHRAISGAGGLTFTGSGTTTLNGAVSYSGKTCVTPDTTLTVANATAKSNILSHGLELVGAPTVGKPYTVFVCNDALDAETDLANVTCGVASEFSKSVGADGKSIVVTVTALKSGYWTGGAGDNNLSTSGNWSDNIVPTSGIAEICCSVATKLTVGDTFAPSTITIPKESAVVTLGAGALHVNTLTNASKLAIGAGASLTVANDIVTTAGAFLHSNEGTVSVGGKARGYTRDATIAVYQYEAVTANTQPIRAKGLAYDGSGSGRLYMILSSQSEKDGMWVLGSDGMTFSSSRNAQYSRFYAEKGAHVMLYSSADWTLGQNNGGSSTDSSLYSEGNTYDTSITLDTSDYDDPTIGRTITLNGRLHAWGAGASFTVKGCGTVVVDTTGDLSVDKNNTRFDENTTLYVADKATLQINAGKKILGAGTISLAAGTTLALKSTGREFATPDIVPVALPAEGAATILIDGDRLRSCEHVLCSLASVPEDLADHVAVTGTALDGRKYEVKAVEVTENEKAVTKLVLNVQPGGLTVIIR